MDKVQTLRVFAQSAVAAALDFDALRLYLLLLAASDPAGHGAVLREVLQATLERSSINLGTARQSLIEARLIELSPSVPGIRPPLFCYRLLPIPGGEP